MSKIDPALRELRLTGTMLPDPPAADQPVNLLVKFSGDLSDLVAVGFISATVIDDTNRGFTIATGRLPLNRVDDLAEIDHLVCIEAAQSWSPNLNKSVAEIGATALHVANPAYTGSGVVVGIIDSGIDCKHQAFRHADGSSRILAIWDQAQDSGNQPPGYAYGSQYLKADIDADNDRPPRDEKGHGTHIAGIAAGNGSKAGLCQGPKTFIGVAPEADLIAVKLKTSTGLPDFGLDLGGSSYMVDALSYIFNHPAAANKAVVVNISLGSNLGAHDGSSLVEQSIDTLVTAKSGRAVVASAGNSGIDLRAGKGTVPANGEFDLTVDVAPGCKTRCFVEIWYPGAQSLNTILSAPDTDATPTDPVSPGDPPKNWSPNLLAGSGMTVVMITSDTNNQDNGDKRIRVTLMPTDGGTLKPGKLVINLKNTNNAETPFHAWIEGDEKTAPRFDYTSKTDWSNPVSPREYNVMNLAGNISVPATGQHTIAVGSYSAKDGQLAVSSSGGPTRDGRTKPDICAPGQGITSALPEHMDEARGSCRCCDCCLDFYTIESGTSAAAPHVAGVVALMLQKNSGLNIGQIRQHLADTARAPAGPFFITPDNSWGHGKVDAGAAVNAVPAPVAGGGGAGGAPGGPSEPLRHPALAPRRGDLFAADPRQQILAMLYRSALSNEDHQLCAALISRHFSEVRGLINSNRRLATLWHRGHGPMLARHLLRRIQTASATRPAQFGEPDYERLLMRFIDGLYRYGSRELRAEIETFAPRFIGHLTDPGFGQTAGNTGVNRPA